MIPGVTIQGNQAWTEVYGGTGIPAQNEFGLDDMTRKFCGSPETYLQWRPRIGSADSIFPYMRVVKVVPDHSDPGLAYCTVYYSGALDKAEALKKVEVVSSRQVKSGQIRGIYRYWKHTTSGRNSSSAVPESNDTQYVIEHGQTWPQTQNYDLFTRTDAVIGINLRAYVDSYTYSYCSLTRPTAPRFTMADGGYTVFSKKVELGDLPEEATDASKMRNLAPVTGPKEGGGIYTQEKYMAPFSPTLPTTGVQEVDGYKIYTGSNQLFTPICVQLDAKPSGEWFLVTETWELEVAEGASVIP